MPEHQIIHHVSAVEDPQKHSKPSQYSCNCVEYSQGHKKDDYGRHQAPRNSELTLDVVTQHLPVALGATLSEALASLSAS